MPIYIIEICSKTKKGGINMKININIFDKSLFGKSNLFEGNSKLNIRREVVRWQNDLLIRKTDQLARQNEKAQENNRRARNRRRRQNSSALVTGATSRNEIRRLIGVLAKRISEIISEKGTDLREKKTSVHRLQRKIESLERILSKIDRAEREQRETGRKRNRRATSETVYLSRDDLSPRKRVRPFWAPSNIPTKPAPPINLGAIYSGGASAAVDVSVDVQS